MKAILIYLALVGFACGVSLGPSYLFMQMFGVSQMTTILQFAWVVNVGLFSMLAMAELDTFENIL